MNEDPDTVIEARADQEIMARAAMDAAVAIAAVERGAARAHHDHVAHRDLTLADGRQPGGCATGIGMRLALMG